MRIATNGSIAAASWAVGSVVAFCAGSAAAKLLGTKLPAIEMTAIRSLVAAVMVAGTWRLLADLKKARDLRGHAIRCLLGVVAIFGLLYAVTVLPLALAMVLYISRTLMMPIAGRWMLGERSGPLVWSAVVLGFAGVLLSSWPEMQAPESRIGILAAVAAAVASAGSQTAVRRLTRTNSAPLIVLIYSAVAVIGTLPVALPVWVMPPIADWPVLVVLGLCAAGAQLFAARAFALAPVGLLAPLDLLGVPVGAIMGWLLFGEVPGMLAGVGGIFVLLAALIVMIVPAKATGLRRPVEQFAKA
ncbi:DMT family transporter [Azospirillum sp. A26]|uniref:DMT family transporter n=1 Tax=Azospirillum sp. A26 TaxID=3160607 RepID=UPI00366B0F97